MTLAEIRELVTSRLPDRYEPLKLAFYGRESRPNGEFVVIGSDYGTKLCVRFGDGVVYSIDPETELPTRFVNSDIDRLGKFIDVCVSFSESPKEAPDKLIWDELRLIDPKAFADPQNWWATVLEQVEHGML